MKPPQNHDDCSSGFEKNRQEKRPKYGKIIKIHICVSEEVFMRVTIGIVLGIASLFWAVSMRGGGLDLRQMILFINIPSALFPALGVVASMLVSYRAADIIRNFKMCRLVRRNKIIIDEDTSRELAQFYDSLGVYSIAWCGIHTILGLVLMAANLTDPAQLLSGFAISALSILYGLAVAYLIFFPLSRRFSREWKKR
ncbi:MAG: hypothetical protein CVU77_00160 [Elusimicrobia bacterium HGW-Elusimicrobia-1]|nr:MAG: hypothetical protein CVU77_00160 [Elusimicrobia bacterium HGW-Elusimicrobia-1]